MLEKMKWDEEANPDDVDDDDNAEFEKLRKVNTIIPFSWRQIQCFFRTCELLWILY